MDQKLHKIMLSKVLISIYKNPFLAQNLGFKGWTAAMFFYWLPRLSVDLDFDIFWQDTVEYRKKIMYELENVLKNFWEITDFADKTNTILYELRYQNDERRLKIEISKRWKSWNFIQKNFLWENIWIMQDRDLFSNKLIALLNRKWVTNRDIFDIWYFFSKWVDLNVEIIEEFTRVSISEYLEKVRDFISNYDFRKVLYWLGEMLNNKQKNFAKTKMKDEILGFLEFYK